MKLPRIWVGVATIAIAALALGWWWLNGRDGVLGTSPELRTYKSSDGWTMKYPASWHLQTYKGAPKIVAERWLARGAVVSDIPSDLHRVSPSTTAWDLSQVPPGFVALDFGISEGGPVLRGHPLKLPLALSAMTTAEGHGSLTAEYESGWKLGHQYLAYAYLGPGVSVKQRLVLQKMLSSINFKGFQSNYVFTVHHVDFDNQHAIATIHFHVAWNGAVFPGARLCSWASHPPGGTRVVLGSRVTKAVSPHDGSVAVHTGTPPQHVEARCGPRLDHGRYVINRAMLVISRGLWRLRYRGKWRGSKVPGVSECPVSAQDKTGREADFNLLLQRARTVVGGTVVAHLSFFRAKPTVSIVCHPYRH
ncbi:MAG: hypothetical protein M3P18_04265 [Actinomycetota bacterium]|nr:hypothetical protein [Actinomycetota bacterium]